jgi:hypothetical protein
MNCNDRGVGYCRPPLKHRFQKGNTQHLKRKKRQFPDVTSILLDVLATPELVKRKGRRVYQPRMQTIVENLLAAAVKGDVAAAQHLIYLHEDTVDLADMAPTVIIFDQPGDDKL